MEGDFGMLKKCCVLISIILLLAAIPVNTALGVDGQITVSTPVFPITLNGVKYYNNDYEPYPFLVYKDITYFPITYYQSNLLNLRSLWTAEGGLVMTNDNPKIPKAFYRQSQIDKPNNRTQIANIVDSIVTINGKSINSQEEEYPLLFFRDITYFPITWRFAVEEFGWNYTFDNSDGLRIQANNYFYTINGDSLADDAKTYNLADNETHFIDGNFRVSIDTHVNRLGPVPKNLSIANNGIEIRPEGYFGYYQRNAPLFSIDGNYIITSYCSYNENILSGDMHLCRINIETGEIIVNSDIE